MTDHQSQCPKEPVDCRFKEAGCDMKQLRSELDDHMTQNTQQHLMLMMGAFQEMKEEYKERLEHLENQLEHRGSQRFRAKKMASGLLLHTSQHLPAQLPQASQPCIFMETRTRLHGDHWY